VGRVRAQAARWLPLAALLALAACRSNALVGSLTCGAPGDCAPPETVCGPDGRCVAGCTHAPQECIGDETCDPLTGQCSGGAPCNDDTDCDPPASVCNTSVHQCEAGCTLSTCPDALNCNDESGHCCDPAGPDCPIEPDGGVQCNGDSECAGAPANICSGGACVPGCVSGGCASPLTCNAATGHCAVPACQRDLDCDPGSYCNPTQMCTVLAFGGPIACAGGTSVSYTCAQKKTPADFRSCSGAPGPSGCPYCIDGSCLHAGLCSTSGDCHREDDCIDGLCRVIAPECPTVVPITDVVAGKYAAGKELCVRDMVTSLRSGSDGMNEIRLGSSPYLYVDVAPMYAASGTRLPNLNETVTVHGTVRWDAGHHDRELLPVDWISAP
jgi:hypothetical protein